MRICFWKDGGSENESNQVVILTINLRLRNRWGIGWMIRAAGKMSQGTEVTWRFCAMLIMLGLLH
jgi:hypothetical protein